MIVNANKPFPLLLEFKRDSFIMSNQKSEKSIEDHTIRPEMEKKLIPENKKQHLQKSQQGNSDHFFFSLFFSQYVFVFSFLMTSFSPLIVSKFILLR